MNVFRVVFYAVVSLNCVIGNFDCFYFDFVVVGVLLVLVVVIFCVLVVVVCCRCVSELGLV